MQTDRIIVNMVVNIRINIKAEQMLKGLRQLKGKFPQASFSIAKEFAEESKREGQAGIIPRRTGNLASTARVISDSSTLSVKFVTGGITGKGSPALFVNYARFVNLGTSKQSPQFFMERSVNRAAGKIDSFSKKTLESWLGIFKK